MHQTYQQEILKLILLVHLTLIVTKEVTLLNKFQSQLECRTDAQQPQVLNPSDRITVRSTDYDRNGTDGIIDVFISFEEKTSTDLVGLGKGVSIAATTAIGIFTSTSNPSVIQSIRLANVTDAGGKVASIIVNDGVTDRFIVDNLVVPKYASIEVLDNLKRIETNRAIKIQVDEAQTIDVQLSAKKITS